MPEQEVSNKCTQLACSQKIGIPVVPVWIHHVDDLKKKVATLALLDNCSQGCFIQDDLLQELGNDLKLSQTSIFTPSLFFGSTNSTLSLRSLDTCLK